MGTVPKKVKKITALTLSTLFKSFYTTSILINAPVALCEAYFKYMNVLDGFADIINIIYYTVFIPINAPIALQSIVLGSSG